jgi:hypothetical protein
MENRVVSPPQIDPAARERFYHLISQAPESEAAWADRQATLRGWRSDPRFEPYWPSIDHMLTDDFDSFRHRAAAMQAAMEAARGLEDYDFDAWRRQREYDLKHARDHLP